MKNRQASVCRYESQPSAFFDDDKLRADTSSYHTQVTQPHSIIVNY